MKYLRIFEIVYLAITVLASIETYREWNNNREKAYIFLFFAIVSLFMFIFRRHYRKRFQSRRNKEE